MRRAASLSLPEHTVDQALVDLRGRPHSFGSIPLFGRVSFSGWGHAYSSPEHERDLPTEDLSAGEHHRSLTHFASTSAYDQGLPALKEEKAEHTAVDIQERLVEGSASCRSSSQIPLKPWRKLSSLLRRQRKCGPATPVETGDSHGYGGRCSSIRNRRRVLWTLVSALVIALFIACYVRSVDRAWEKVKSEDVFMTAEMNGPDAKEITNERRWGYSHNDEMQNEQITLALRLGLGAIEVDTWLQPSSGHTASDPVSSDNLTLCIGHKEKEVTGKTLKEQYLDPILSILDANNAHSNGTTRKSGVYADDPDFELQLLIDMKSDGDATWPYLVSALQPFLDKGYLTTYNNTTEAFAKGPLRIIGTGNTPIAQVYYSSSRSIFYDAPLLNLSSPVSIPETPAGPAATFEWDNTIAPMASSKFPVTYNLVLAMWPENTMTKRLSKYTAVATERRIKSRWWGATRSPGWARRRMWEVQRMTGVDWFNADDLEDLAAWLDQ